MKKFEIQLSYCVKKKKFYVYNGWNKWLYFKNKRKADDWRRKAQRVFRDTQMQLHNLNSQTYNLYSMFYFNLDDKTTRRHIINLGDFEKYFRHAFHNWSDGNSIKFDSIYTCFQCVEDSLLMFKKFAKRNKQYAFSHQSNILIKSHQLLLRQFDLDIVDLDLVDRYSKINSSSIKVLNSFRKVS